MDGISDLVRMAAENDAWSRVCGEFERLTLQSLSEPQCAALAACIRIWGEELATLRRGQGSDGIKHGRKVREEETARIVADLVRQSRRGNITP